MSYILEALKKAEQQRDIGRVPGIESDHGSRNSGHATRWIWLILIVLCINAVLLALALWPDKPAPQRVNTGLTSEGRSVAKKEEAVQSGRLKEEHAAIAAESVPVAPPPVAQPLRRLPVAPAKPALRSLPSAPVAVLPPASGSSAMSGKVIDQPENLPVWPQVPEHLFRQVGSSLHLDVHVYSETPQERFVLINMKKYGEGDRLQDGVMVDEITIDGVIMSFRGERFRVQSQ